ncbi:MAG: cyclodeaminase/cyclohydrolase family protein, partial [Thermoplasmata archaeon]
MVLAYSNDPAKPADDLRELVRRLTEGRRRMLSLVEEDARSYEAVRAARKARKGRPGDASTEAAYLSALRGAASVPLETARLSEELSVTLEGARARTKPALASDLVTALALFRSATEGALANVAINLDDLKAAGEPTAEVEAELQRLRAKG